MDDLEKLRNERDDAINTLKAWFEVRSMAQEQLAPEFIKCLQGYLRTSRSGGMPQEQSDLVESILEDFARLYLAPAIWPILLRIGEEKRGELKAPEGLPPVNGMTDSKILDAINRHLENTPKMPVAVSDMNDHEREFFKVIAYQSGMMLFLQNMMADRVRHQPSDAEIGKRLDWRPIDTHEGHGAVMVICDHGNEKYLIDGPFTAFRDVTGVWRCHGSAGGSEPLAYTPTHWKPLQPAPLRETL